MGMRTRRLSLLETKLHHTPRKMGKKRKTYEHGQRHRLDSLVFRGESKAGRQVALKLFERSQSRS